MQHNQDQHRQQRGKPPFPFNSAPINADLTRLLEISSKVAPYHGSPPRAPTRPPRQNPPGSLPRRRRVSSSPSRHRVPSSNGSHAGDFEQHQYEPPGALYRSSSDQRLDSLHRDPERECVRRSNPPRPASLGRPPCTRSRSSARSDDLRAPGGLRKRSQSLGDRMALAVANPREPPPPSSLLLYHVSRPEPRGTSPEREGEREKSLACRHKYSDIRTCMSICKCQALDLPPTKKDLKKLATQKSLLQTDLVLLLPFTAFAVPPTQRGGCSTSPSITTSWTAAPLPTPSPPPSTRRGPTSAAWFG